MLLFAVNFLMLAGLFLDKHQSIICMFIHLFYWWLQKNVQVKIENSFELKNNDLAFYYVKV